MTTGIPIHIGDSRDDQKVLLIASGFKPTGFTAMDGRFEVIRQPKGVYGPAVTWTIWDYNWADKISIYAVDTLKDAKASLRFLAERRLHDEMDLEMKCEAGWHCGAYPDGSERWFSPEECRAAGWKMGPDEDGSIYWLMPNGSHANLDSYPDTPTQEESPDHLARKAKLGGQQ